MLLKKVWPNVGNGLNKIHKLFYKTQCFVNTLLRLVFWLTISHLISSALKFFWQLSKMTKNALRSIKHEYQHCLNHREADGTFSKTAVPQNSENSRSISVSQNSNKNAVQ